MSKDKRPQLPQFRKLYDMMAKEEFAKMVSMIEDKINTGEFQRTNPRLFASGILPAKTLEETEEGVGIPTLMVEADFAQYKSPAQQRTIRKIARNYCLGEGATPVMVGVLCEATMFCPTPEEIEYLEKHGYTSEALQQVKDDGASERVVDALVIAGMTVNKEALSYMRLIDYTGEKGDDENDDKRFIRFVTADEYVDKGLDKAERKVPLRSINVDGLQERILSGGVIEFGSVNDKHASGINIVSGAAMNALTDFFMEVTRLAVKYGPFSQFAGPDAKPMPEESLADSVNSDTITKWK